jgi:hypothetical protein
MCTRHRFARYAEFAEPADADLDALSDEASSAVAGRLREAEYHGTCPGCGLKITPGDTVRWSFLEETMVHDECAVTG